jgi:transposase
MIFGVWGIDGRKLSQDEQELRRLRAQELLEKGRSVTQVVEMLGASRSWVFAVAKKVREGGVAALVRTPRPEGPKKLDGARRRELFTLVRDFTPLAFGFGSVLWTRQIVQELIYERWGVDLSLPTVGEVLRDLGLSPQKPLRRAIEQDPEAVARWRDEEYPRIRAQAREQDAEVYFGDEAGVRSDYHSGTTWSPVGQTPVVPATGNRTSVSMLSAVSGQGRISFTVTTGGVGSAVFVEFCRKLLADAAGRIVYLIVDNASSHKSKLTREFVESTSGRLKLFFLPPYSPELNPDELVWKNVKHDHIGKAVIRNAAELHSRATGALEALRDAPNLVRNFFHAPSLAYINE